MAAEALREELEAQFVQFKDSMQQELQGQHQLIQELAQRLEATMAIASEARVIAQATQSLSHSTLEAAHAHRKALEATR